MRSPWFAVLVVGALLGACAHDGGRPTTARATIPVPDLPLEAFALETRGFRDTEGAELRAIWGRYGLHHRGVAQLAFTEDGRELISLSGRHGLRVWGDVRAQSLRCESPGPDRLAAGGNAVLALTRDGRFAATAISRPSYASEPRADEARTVRLWDLRTCQAAGAFHADEAPILAMSFADDDRTLLTFGYHYESHDCDPLPKVVMPRPSTRPPPKELGGELRAWDVATGALRAKAFLGPATIVAIDRERPGNEGGRTMQRIAGLDRRTGTLRVWDRARPERPLWQHEAPPRAPCERTSHRHGPSLSFARDGHLVVTEEFAVRVLDGASGKVDEAFDVRAPLLTAREESPSILVGPDRVTAFVGPTDTTSPSLCRLGGPCRQLSETSHFIERPAAFSESGWLAAARNEGIGLWDVATGAEHVGGGHRNHVAMIDVSADGSHAVSCSQLDGSIEDRTVRVWEVASGREIARWSLGATSARFSADGARIVVTRPDTRPTYGSTQSISLATGRPSWSTSGAEYEQGRFAATTSAIAPDRSREAHAVFEPSQGQRLVMQDVTTGREIWTSPTITTGVAFLPDGRELLAADEHGTFWLHDAASGRRIRSVDITPGTRTLLVTADGSRVIGASPGLRVYDLATGKLVRTLDADWAGPLTLTRDDLLITGEYDGSIRLRPLTATGPGAPDAGRIDLSTSEDRPTSFALLDRDRELLVGTERGVILRFRRR